MRISDWSSDVCSSDLPGAAIAAEMAAAMLGRSVDFRGAADLDLVVADERPADERRARMAAAITAMTKGMMLHRGAHRIADRAAMALAAGAGGFVGHRSLLKIGRAHV